MITQKRKYKFNGSATSTNVTYSIVSDNNCVSITPSSNTVAKGTIVEFTFQFEDEACFSSEFTITSTDDACIDPKITTFNLSNSCGSLSAVLTNAPSSTNPFIFNLTITGGSPNYTVTWQYDTVLFDLLSQSGSGATRSLQLSPKYLSNSNLPTPSFTVVKANVVDNNGCEETVEYIYTLCQPAGHNDFVTLNCIPTQTISGTTVYTGLGNIELIATECTGTTNDWTTLELSYDTSKLLVLSEAEFINIYGKQNLTSAVNIPITYSVANSIGVRSVPKTIMVQIPLCQDSTNAVVVQSKNIKLLSTDTGGTIKYLDVDSITFDVNE